MSNLQVLYDIEEDSERKTQQYVSTDNDVIYINDNNSGIYSAGYINFNSQSLVGSTQDKLINLRETYLVIPYSVVLTLSNATFVTTTDENAFAVLHKGVHQFINNMSLTYNGQTINNVLPNHNLVMTERLKMMAKDKFSLVGSTLAYDEWDSAESLSYSTLGKVNNNTDNTTLFDFATGLSGGVQNRGFIERLLRNCRQKGSNSATYVAENYLQQGCHYLVGYSSGNSIATYEGYAILPLAVLADYFKEFPSCKNLMNFDLKLQTNLGSQNVCTVNFTDPGTSGHRITAIDSVNTVMSNGETFPFQIADLANGLDIVITTTGTAASMTIVGTVSNSGGLPCRMYIRTSQLTPSYDSQLLKSPSTKLWYEDTYIDFDNQIQSGQSVSRLFNTNLSRIRWLMIIPFLNDGTHILPYQSPLSSAPNTSSLCKFTNLNVQLGGRNVFMTNFQYDYNQYMDNYLSLNSESESGNSFSSPSWAGQITKNMWEKGYNTVLVNLERASADVEDNIPKQVQLQYQISNSEGKATAKYKIFYIIGFQKGFSLNRVTGAIEA